MVMRGLPMVMVACACLVVLLTAGTAPAGRADDCTWGASSVLVQEVNGKLVQSEPATSGCIPR
jgi:hypothetical protein